MMTAYKNLGFDIKDYPNAYDHLLMKSRCRYIKLTDEEVDYIIATLKLWQRI